MCRLAWGFHVFLALLERCPCVSGFMIKTVWLGLLLVFVVLLVMALVFGIGYASYIDYG